MDPLKTLRVGTYCRTHALMKSQNCTIRHGLGLVNKVASKLRKKVQLKNLQMVLMTGPHLMLWNSWWMMRLE
ncbi:hypothetical protein RHMOL_Rhmol04G0353100 [Rhododendron molle]|uniref:Uncharacterized protein n=1 Tax=Rhododendron molle TaxID=49168 RepID=A0ACC0P9B5_RHOML|nr:hypothetical protein RHMOL_Rhmol04G0353100 [Rhododendron molle]